MKGRSVVQGTDASVSPSLTLSPPAFEDPVLDELSRRMLSWGRMWFGSSESGGATGELHRVREQLLYWIKRCIGGKAVAVVTSRDEEISLAASTPLLTAFLGRRAMVELSRRVLNDS